MPESESAVTAADRRALLIVLMPYAVIGMIFLLVGLGLTVSNATASRQRSDLANTGVRTTATVVDEHVGSFGSDSYLVVAYNVDGVARRAQIHVDIPTSYATDKPLDIAYDPADPSRVDLVSGGGSRAALLWAGMFVVIGGGSVGYAVLWFLFCLKATTGRASTAATATACWRPWGKFGQTWLEIESPELLRPVYVRVPGRTVRAPLNDQPVDVVGDMRTGGVVLIKTEGASVWPSGRLTHERPGNLRLR